MHFGKLQTCSSIQVLKTETHASSMAEMNDLPDALLGKSFAYAVEGTNLAQRLCSFEHVSSQWKNAIRGDSGSEAAWNVGCQQIVSGSKGHTREATKKGIQ